MTSCEVKISIHIKKNASLGFALTIWIYMHARALIRAHVMSLFNNSGLPLDLCLSLVVNLQCHVTNNNIIYAVFYSDPAAWPSYNGSEGRNPRDRRSAAPRSLSLQKKRKEVLLRPTSVDRHVYSMTTRCRPCMECKKRSGRRHAMQEIDRTSSTVHCRMQVCFYFLFLAGWVVAGCRE